MAANRNLAAVYRVEAVLRRRRTAPPVGGFPGTVKCNVSIFLRNRMRCSSVNTKPNATSSYPLAHPFLSGLHPSSCVCARRLFDCLFPPQLLSSSNHINSNLLSTARLQAKFIPNEIYSVRAEKTPLLDSSFARVLLVAMARALKIAHLLQEAKLFQLSCHAGHPCPLESAFSLKGIL